MAYKDKDKQRATTRARVARFRARKAGVTLYDEAVTPCDTPIVTPKPYARELTKARQTSNKGFNE